MVRFLVIMSATALLVGCTEPIVGSNATMPQAASRSQPNARLASETTSPDSQLCPRWPSGSGVLRDGDFHRAPDFGRGYQRYWAGQGFAKGWRVTKRTVDLSGSIVWPAPNGVCKVDLDGDTVGAIEHAPFTTTPSSSYTVTFLFSGNGDGPPTTKTMKVEAAGQSEILTWNTSNGNDAQHGVYSAETWAFSATSARTILRFTSLDPKNPGYGPVVAAISVTKN
jgi:hypothetical protein